MNELPSRKTFADIDINNIGIFELDNYQSHAQIV